jgi:hypothetical protein
MNSETIFEIPICSMNEKEIRRHSSKYIVFLKSDKETQLYCLYTEEDYNIARVRQ